MALSPDDIIQYIRRPQLLDEERSEKMAGLVHDYPWFQTAHLLYLRALKNINSLKFPDALRYGATFIGNRRKLFYLLHEDLSADREREIPVEEEKASEEPLRKEPSGDMERPLAHSFTVWLEEFRKQETPERPLEEDVSKQRKLIDKFIEERPGIKKTPVQEPPGEQTDISIHSVQPDEGFLTETLARIYIKQKNYAKARYIYEKLSLKYPEKSDYFASRIKEFNDQIKEQ